MDHAFLRRSDACWACRHPISRSGMITHRAKVTCVLGTAQQAHPSTCQYHRRVEALLYNPRVMLRRIGMYPGRRPYHHSPPTLFSQHSAAGLYVSANSMIGIDHVLQSACGDTDYTAFAYCTDSVRRSHPNADPGEMPHEYDRRTITLRGLPFAWFQHPRSHPTQARETPAHHPQDFAFSML